MVTEQQRAIIEAYGRATSELLKVVGDLKVLRIEAEANGIPQLTIPESGLGYRSVDHIKDAGVITDALAALDHLDLAFQSAVTPVGRTPNAAAVFIARLSRRQ